MSDKRYAKRWKALAKQLRQLVMAPSEAEADALRGIDALASELRQGLQRDAEFVAGVRAVIAAGAQGDPVVDALRDLLAKRDAR
jgi:hypothetical protein